MGQSWGVSSNCPVDETAHRASPVRDGAALARNGLCAELYAECPVGRSRLANRGNSLAAPLSDAHPFASPTDGKAATRSSLALDQYEESKGAKRVGWRPSSRISVSASSRRSRRRSGSSSGSSSSRSHPISTSALGNPCVRRESLTVPCGTLARRPLTCPSSHSSSSSAEIGTRG
jgi:hypothetical protein